MVSKGKFRYIRNVYRNLEHLQRFREVFGTPVTFTIADLSPIILDPIDLTKVHQIYTLERDISKCIGNAMGVPMHLLTTEKGPVNNVTYL